MSQNQNGTSSSVLAPQPARNLLFKIAQELQENWSEGPGDAASKAAFEKAPVLNGTGVLLHPKLGRAPLGAGVYEKLKAVVLGYSNFETLGDSTDYLNAQFELLVPEYKPVWVNNSMAATLLALSTLSKKSGLKRVVISRGELMELVGGFRLSDLILEAGLEIIEVGTTNVTRLGDYEGALKLGAAILLKAQPGNFSIEGSVHSAPAQDIAFMARKWDVPFVLHADSLSVEQLKKSPSSVSAVICSTDKALGGPQGGLMMVQPDLQRDFLRNPLYRALRLDKIRLAALETVIRAYVDKKEKTAIPYCQLTQTTVETLKNRAKTFEGLSLKNLSIKSVSCHGNVGEGFLGSQKTPSWGLQIDTSKVATSQGLVEIMAQSTPSLVVESAENTVIVNLLTILPTQDEELKKALLHIDASLGNKNVNETKST